MPVPVRAKVCGLPDALSVSVYVPLAAPTAVGENITLIWQEENAATVREPGSPRSHEPEVVMNVNGGPLTCTLVITRSEVPVLSNLTLIAPGCPTATGPELNGGVPLTEM